MSIRKGEGGLCSAGGKGIILYDFLYCKGGAEQVTLDLVRGLHHADLCVAFRDHEVFDDTSLAGSRCLEIGKPVYSPGLRSLAGLTVFSRRTKFLSRYDWVLFSGSNAPVAVHNHPAGRNIYYCHTIPRFVYDLKTYYLATLPVWQRPLLHALIQYVRPRYEAALQRMDRIVANSENVRARLQHFLGLEATVVYPPCHIEAYQWEGQGDYYLSTARLEPYKRVDLIVEAFRGMPNRKLIVASGGSDLPRLKHLAQGADNIEFTGWVDDGRLKALMGRAIATIYVPRDEDFGMSPVESMAAGKPVIGVAEGGLMETIVDGQTGLLLPAAPEVDDLVDAVQRLTPARAREMRGACEEQARKFETDVFLRRMRQVVEDR